MTNITVSESVINANTSLLWKIVNSESFIPSYFPAPAQLTLKNIKF